MSGLTEPDPSAGGEAVRELEQQVGEIQLSSEHGEQDRIYAEFQTTIGQNDRVVNKTSFLYLFAPRLFKTWKLELNLKSFEVMHGLSRVTKLIPDKLATAIAINKEELPDPDDGGFLVQLVVDLVVSYKDRLADLDRQLQQEDDEGNVVSRIEELDGGEQQDFKAPEVSTGLFEILNEFLSKMVSIQSHLKSRNVDGINSDAQTILQMADDILGLSIAYMDFIHPIYLDVQRHGVFNEEKIEDLKSKVIDNLVENKKKLQQEFDSLTKPRETEE